MRLESLSMSILLLKVTSQCQKELLLKRRPFSCLSTSQLSARRRQKRLKILHLSKNKWRSSSLKWRCLALILFMRWFKWATRCLKLVKRIWQYVRRTYWKSLMTLKSISSTIFDIRSTFPMCLPRMSRSWPWVGETLISCNGHLKSNHFRSLAIL